MKEEFKSKAKAYLDGNWPEVVITTIIFMLLTSVSTSDSWLGFESGSFKFGLQGGLGQVFSLVVTGPLSYGFIRFIRSLKTSSSEISQLFVGFKERFKETFIAHIITTLFVVLWSLLLIIPGIIAAISYTMVYLILQDNPNINAFQAIQKSKAMMNGNKMRFFVFALGFAGWFILGILTLGIGLLYAVPYYTSAKIEFYEDLKMQERKDYTY